MASRELNLYRAFEEYRRNTYVDLETKKFQKFFATNNGKKYEDIKVIYSTCTIDETWVKQIEYGLPFLEKAIREERQFIRNDEEVLPIEKIKKVTSDGIKDLAKHSNYITHEPDNSRDAVVIPDKMLMVQRESDYAVYENRVIYATLLYLKEFVSSRLSKIKEATHKYEAQAYIKKKIDIGNRKINLDFTLDEIRIDDPLRASKNEFSGVIDRIDNILSNVMAFLKTPLMTEVSHADVVSRPITKNNVLKMNINFRESLALFDYLAEYSGDGFTIQTFEKTFSPFTNEISNAYSDVVMLSSFLTYMYGNNITEELRQEYIADEARRKKEEEERILQKLKALSFKSAKDNMTLNEYLDEFEKGYRILERQVAELEKGMNDIKELHKKELSDQAFKYEQKIESIYEEEEKAKDAIKADYENQLKVQFNDFTTRIEEIREAHREEVSSVSHRFEETKKQIITDKDVIIYKLQSTNENQDKQIKELTDEKEVNSSLIIALKQQLGQKVNADDYQGRNNFDELEKSKKAFDKFFNEAWKLARKNIRKNVFADEKALRVKEKEDKKNKKNKVEAVETPKEEKSAANFDAGESIAPAETFEGANDIFGESTDIGDTK